jgi:protein-S-isoprenylcysteine O-methyltransferase
MASLAIRRHVMPAASAIPWAVTALACGAPRPGAGIAWLAIGAALLALHWVVEWRGISGAFENRVPRHPLVVATRAVWAAGLVVAVIDTARAHWTPWQGASVRAAGVALALAGVGLRLWSMRALAGAFSYDLKVVEGHELVRHGPYRWLRHPSYTGMLLWSVGLGLWNPSVPGLVLLVAGTLPQLAYRIAVEERLLAGHFGAAWDAHARATDRLVPFVW